MGRHDEAVSEIQRAAALDPLSPLVASNVGRVLYHARRFGEAIQVLTKSLEVDPTRVYSRIHLSMSLEEAGRYAEERAELERIREHFDGQAGVGFAHYYAVAGQAGDARKLLHALEQRAGDSDWFFLAGVHAALGERDLAFACLERAYQRRDFFLPYLKVHPWIEPLRSDPRYSGLIHRIGLS